MSSDLPSPGDTDRAGGGTTPVPSVPPPLDSALLAALAADNGQGPLPVDPAGRYVLVQELDRGGMGIVYRAVDRNLGRDVAVKVPAPSQVDRFTREARITGRLQHPGLPPVHEVGELADGRPFLAMKLIQGRTLADLLADRPDPAAERARLLTVFEQVCQAVAYAHSQEVIHRDLKPANVMVGAFGEVQVMDWGVAKELRADPGPARAQAPTATAGSPAESTAPVRGGEPLTSLSTTAWYGRPEVAPTQSGSVLGSYGYMAPEQARGAIDAIDQRTDVFGLGAILCAVLTGRAPFAGPDPKAIPALTKAGDLTNARDRLAACGADPALVTLCERCLSPSSVDRPADAGVVARVVAEIRAAAEDRARRIEVERAQAKAQAAERALQFRRQVALTQAAVTYREAIRADPTDAQAYRNLGLTLKDKGDLDGAIEAFREAIRLDLERADADTHSQLGWALYSKGDLDGAVAAYRTAAERDPGSAIHHFQLGWALHARGDLAGTEAAYREAVRLDPGNAAHHFHLGLALHGADDPAGAEAAFCRAIELDPDHSASRSHLGLVLHARGDLAGAVAACRRAIELDPTDPWARNHLGAALKAQGDLAGAVSAFREAARLDPDHPAAHFNLGLALHEVGDRAGAEAAFREALRVDPSNDTARQNLGLTPVDGPAADPDGVRRAGSG